MKRTSLLFLALVIASAATSPVSARKTAEPSSPPVIQIETRETDEAVAAQLGLRPPLRLTSASANTTVLYTADFDLGGSCFPAGWTQVDHTAQSGTYFHIDDYNGLSFGPLRGAKSLWCGARPSSAEPLCQYATLPGYGNNWNQAFCTKACLQYSGTVAVDYLARWDSEANYDATYLEHTEDCVNGITWTVFAGGFGDLDGTGQALRHDAFAAAGTPSKIRFHFTSDGAWSDQDGQFASDGAIHIDSLSVGDGSGLRIVVEDFEDEMVGTLSATDWTSCTPPGYGIFAGVFPGAALLQEDPCIRDLTCSWAFIQGSTATYGCGGHPEQKAVPFGNARGQFFWNEIWSPPIPLTGNGTGLVLTFSVYRDLPLDNLIFYAWLVRPSSGTCPGPWKKRDNYYYGGTKDWYTSVSSIGDLINPSTSSNMQIALIAHDECKAWCGIYGSGLCHSHAPLFDHVKLMRIELNGPQWFVRDYEQFQDNFADDGTVTGTVRADMANDILPANNLNIIPGDSATVQVADPVAGIANDLVNGGKKIYAYVAVWPQGQAGKSGAALTQNATRFPWVGSQVIGGVTWDCVRLDPCKTGSGNPIPDRYCVDLNDNLFTPGDTVCFFYCAENTNGVRTYAFGTTLGSQGDDVDEAAANAGEFTCLPAGGWKRGGSVLYVDGMDGRGAEPYWDTAFQQLSLLDKVDRYDVRGPSSGVSNRLDGRVKDPFAQLLDCYLVMLWDCGDLSITLGQGTGSPEKTDDYGLLNTFLDNLANPGGVYIGGDDVAEQLNGYSSASATTFKSTYLTYTLTSGNHRMLFGVSPKGVHAPGSYFSDDFYIFGGCPLLNDFDVMTATGSSTMQITYGPNTGTNGAVISKITNNSNGVNVGVMMSGFSPIYIRDDENDGISDRVKHVRDILRFASMGTVPNPTATGAVAANSLSQNYPNPFNPATTIAFSIRERGPVTLVIYNVAGERVRTLADESCAAGPHTKVWDGRNDAGQPVSSGVYFYRLTTKGFQQTRKMVLLK